ncbi:MAG: YihY/virulence factor BrkB family protein [Phycisphaerae bacterium]|nr:YihY/virulence factor BrkB family protein [Phycisphaerae bacterium]
MLTKLLSTPTAQLGKAGRFVVFQIKLWSHCARLLKINRAGQQAAALSYHTIFGIVPLFIVMLWVFQLSPDYSEVGEKMKSFIYNQAHLSNIKYPDPQNTEQTIRLTEHLDRVVANFFTRAGQGTITIISVVIVTWVALSLLSIIERAFNNIWHVAKGRSFLHRVINYWALLTLGPLLLGLGAYATKRYAALGQIQETILTNITPVVLSYIIATFAFFLLYFILPNTKVQKRAAIWGAAVAALVWSVAKWGFGQYVTEFIPYSKVYGVLGLIPLGVLWIYITWLIVLFGLQLTFTTQHLKSLDAAEISAAKKTDVYFIANDLTAMNIAREIGAAFQKNQAPVSPEVICSKLSIPAEFGEKLLDHLVDSGIIMKTSEPKLGFVPAQEPANIKLSEIAAAVAEVSFAQSPTEQPEALKQITQAQRDALARHSLKEILGDLQTPSTFDNVAERDNET